MVVVDILPKKKQQQNNGIHTHTEQAPSGYRRCTNAVRIKNTHKKCTKKNSFALHLVIEREREQKTDK